MTVDKDRKRIIRDRMKKTGESYTAARVQILSRKKTVNRPAPAATVDFAKLAGMSNDKVAQATGRTWREWTELLDAEDASTMRHRDIALMVHEKYGVREWWTQTVTVGYERIKGLRDRGQRRGGGYEMTKSRTFNVPVECCSRRGPMTGSDVGGSAASRQPCAKRRHPNRYGCNGRTGRSSPCSSPPRVRRRAWSHLRIRTCRARPPRKKRKSSGPTGWTAWPRCWQRGLLGQAV